MSESDDEERPKMERWRPKVAASKNKPPADMPKPSSADPPRLPAYMPKPPADEPKPPKPKPPKLSAPSTVSSECSSLDTGESPRIHDVTIDIDYEGGRPWLGSDGILLEILKSIVYGGSMAVITSLSVVAFAAASDATTLSIISLALASLAGGFFFIRHNLWELRDDCYKFDNEAKYKELLGEVNFFPLHVFS
ncbi:putative Ccc1 family protein [Helianthus annuus]|uniref:Uncharacterized protein n=1 Tax=Helianthus annuus TaxID=4232 RepID=A0A251U9E2_HELAN|nr:membrane protein of ER body 2 isoform X2 [Helianthus annuus]KAJ0549181.1 putative Ccc1 family protein [Helianthus annuus]KAJ0562133.1 putative Ccc1 family protein [Helianthus annuus]KAJ0727508.1 putative Ccc1 family protein [Helianthus annuus]KAJ0730305.1 putative Ccc1 family protein [Helianthus annuus]KAJ0906783.1 putative Ccc1 family protein [Helianthus annuus]